MKVYNNINDFARANYTVVSVGTFDGLHIGHQKIFKSMIELARENNGETVVVTFDPHPRLVIHENSKNLKFINTLEKKFQLIEKIGIDHLIIIPFTKEFAKTSSEDFIKEYLVDKLSVKKLVVGYDHHFGKNREGNYDQVNMMGEKFEFEVIEIPAQYIDDSPVSSTKIRNALMEGNIRIANAMLGYDYSITGIVVEGNKIGRKIDFPTANLEIEDKYKLIAAGGVYACKVIYKNKTYYGMGNIGTRPTIGKHDFTTEVHIFDFDEETYGEELTICFVDRIRDERKFEGLEELKKQLIQDRKIASKLLQ